VLQQPALALLRSAGIALSAASAVAGCAAGAALRVVRPSQLETADVPAALDGYRATVSADDVAAFEDVKRFARVEPGSGSSARTGREGRNLALPIDCLHSADTDEHYYIRSDTSIDCGACEPVRPVTAMSPCGHELRSSSRPCVVARGPAPSRAITCVPEPVSSTALRC